MIKIAAHQVIVGNEVLSPAIIELENGIVEGYYEFKIEQPNTLWIGGVIELEENEYGELVAYQNDKPLVL